MSRRPVLLAVACLTTVALAAPALATPDVSVRRLSGDDRYETSAAIAGATFTAGATVAVLASGERFPDALAGSYTAGRLDAPLLLTASAALSPATEAQLDDLGTSGVVLVGGTDALSPAVESRLRTLGYEVERVAGTNRYDTARAIAQTYPQSFIGSFGAGRTAILASGERFPDALSGSPVSYAESFPTLLSLRDQLPTETRTALEELDIQQVLLLGGESALSPAVRSQVEALGISVRRIAGRNRQETAVAFAAFAIDELGFQADNIDLARGDDYADALSGGANGGVERSPLLLTSTTTALGMTSAEFLRGRNATVASIDVFGGVQAVSAAVADEADRAATTP
jgi:putative cell wall-binding protein